MVPAASWEAITFWSLSPGVYLISSVMPVSSLIFFPTSVLEKSSGSVLPISSTYACTVMVRSAIQVSGLSDVSSVAASEDVLLLLVDALSVLLPHPAKLPTTMLPARPAASRFLIHLFFIWFLPFFLFMYPVYHRLTSVIFLQILLHATTSTSPTSPCIRPIAVA